MTAPYFSAATVDDLLRLVLDEIYSHGEKIDPTKGEAIEVRGVLIELTNPRARLSRTETRGKPYSCLGELCWYLAKSNALEFILYYIPAYKKYADGEEIFGGYGPRLFAWRNVNQFRNVIERLRTKPHSRKAVIQLFDAHDILEEHNDIPCTCTLQFMLRANTLHMITYMRSNDVFLGFPHDVFCFTMLQEIMARDLSAELGTYKHAVGSLHLYSDSTSAARKFLDEGWQATDSPMPPMPSADPWPGVDLLLKAEAAIRTGAFFDDAELAATDPYWADLVRLLQVFRCKKDRNFDRLRDLRDRMASSVYQPFIDAIPHKARSGR